MKSIKKYELILLVILFLGLFLRVYDLGKESVWFDEAYSISMAKFNVFQIFVETAKDDYNPPFYYIILHYWIKMFGDSEFSSRFPSVIFGFFTILMIFKVGSLIFDKEVGVLGALLLGLSVFNIQYSQEARCYTLLTLTSLLSIYFFIKFLEKRTYLVLLGYLLSSMLLMYSHLYGLFIIIAQNIYIFTLFLCSGKITNSVLKRWILLQVVLLFLFIPGIAFSVVKAREIVHHNVSIGSPTNLYQVIIGSFKEYSSRSSLLLLFLILSSFSIVTYEKIRGGNSWKDIFQSIENYRWSIGLSNVDRVYLLLLWLLSPIVLPFIMSEFLTPIYRVRYAIPASLAFYLLVAKGIRNVNSKHFKFAIIGLLIVLSLWRIQSFYSLPYKDQWRELTTYINTNTEYGDLLVFNFYGTQQWPFNYYSRRTDLIEYNFDKNLRENELVPSANGYKKLWYIKSLGQGPQDDKQFKERISESYNLYYSKKYVGIELYLFKKK